jgi:hypothetical protein
VDRAEAVKAIAGLRAAVGVGAWLAPRQSGRLFGIDPHDNPQAPYVGRLFGARDVALAYGALSSQGEAQDRWIVAGLACDLADAAAGIAGGRGGYLKPLSSVMVTATALSAAAFGAMALRGAPAQQ